MPLLPSGPFALAAFGLILVGLYVVVAKRDVPKAYGLSGLILLVFGLQVTGALARGEGVGEELGFQTTLVLDGKWWAPLTAMFVHADPLHLFGNLFLLVAAGPALEDRIGERKFLLIFFLAGFAGFLAHLLLSFVVPDIVPTWATALGASGAIFGVLTTYAVRYPRSTLPVFLGFFLLWMPAFVVLLIYLGFNVVYLVSDYQGVGTGIAWWGHFAGFLVGLPFAYTLPQNHPEATPRGTKGLPDPEKLAPLATTPETKRLLERVRQFNPEARTQHDSTFALAWVDRLLAKAECPHCGKPFDRRGLVATCRSGETSIDFTRS